RSSRAALRLEWATRVSRVRLRAAPLAPRRSSMRKYWATRPWRHGTKSTECGALVVSGLGIANDRFARHLFDQPDFGDAAAFGIRAGRLRVRETGPGYVLASRPGGHGGQHHRRRDQLRHGTWRAPGPGTLA